MSKSFGNYIAIEDDKDQMFGKIMSISDELMWKYFHLLSFKSEKDINQLKQKEQDGINPRDIKFILAEEIVDRFHGDSSGIKAREEFKKRFQLGEVPTEVNEIILKLKPEEVTLPKVLKESGMTVSTSEALRLINQGAVKIEGEKINDPKVNLGLNSIHLYQVGKKKFLRIKIAKK